MIEDLRRIENKLDLIIEHFGITELRPEMKEEIRQKVLAFQKKRKYNEVNECEAAKRR